MKQSIHTNHKIASQNKEAKSSAPAWTVAFCFAKQGGFMSSLWTENIEMPEFPTFGKGHPDTGFDHWRWYGGCFCAPIFLQQAGVDYCLLEKDRICQGVTGHTTAKLRRKHGLIYEKSLHVHGTGACRTVSESKFKSGGKFN